MNSIIEWGLGANGGMGLLGKLLIPLQKLPFPLDGFSGGSLGCGAESMTAGGVLDIAERFIVSGQGAVHQL